MEACKETHGQAQGMTSGTQKDAQFNDTENHSSGVEVAGVMSRYKERESEDDSSQIQPFCIIQNGMHMYMYFKELKDMGYSECAHDKCIGCLVSLIGLERKYLQVL